MVDTGRSTAAESTADSMATAAGAAERLQRPRDRLNIRMIIWIFSQLNFEALFLLPKLNK